MQLLKGGGFVFKKRRIAVAIVFIVVIGSAFYFRQRFGQTGVLPLDSSPYPARRYIEPFLPFLVPSGEKEQEPSQSSSSIGVVYSPAGNSTTSGSNSVFKAVVYGGSSIGNQLQTLTSINWSADGSIIPGETRNSSKVCFRNEGNIPFRLYLSTSDWSFRDAVDNTLAQNYSQYFRLMWDYDNSDVVAGETREVTLTLGVSTGLAGVETFSFNVVVTISY